MDEKFEDQIAQMVDKAEKLTRDYELLIKRGDYDNECPYPKVIEIYEDIKQKLIDKGWNDQAIIYDNQISIYQDKLEKDKKLREIEAQRVKKNKEFEDLLKINEIDSVRATILSLNKEEELLNFEERQQELAMKSESIFSIINNAENMAKEYEIEIKKGRILDLDCPYEKIIDLYQEAKRKFEEIGWKEESTKLEDSIRFYYEKIEKDNRLRDIEKNKQ